MTSLSSDPKQWNVGLIGYGEVGRILAEDLRQQDVKVAAYDIKLRSDQTGRALRDHARQHGVALTASHADLAAQSDFIVSAVTASQAVSVAEQSAQAIKRGAWFLDFNSASPRQEKLNGRRPTSGNRLPALRRNRSWAASSLTESSSDGAAGSPDRPLCCRGGPRS